MYITNFLNRKRKMKKRVAGLTLTRKEDDPTKPFLVAIFSASKHNPTPRIHHEFLKTKQNNQKGHANTLKESVSRITRR
jgi:hypothetical protein